MSEFNVINFLVNLVLTVLICVLPIVIIRYLILKCTVNKKKAKIIIAINVVFCAIIMFILVLLSDSDAKNFWLPIVFWNYIDYKLLIGKKETSNRENT